MTEGGCIGEFPHNVIGDELLPLRVVVDKCLDVLLQESARDCHLSFLVHLLVGVKIRKQILSKGARPGAPKTTYQAGKTIASPDQRSCGRRRFGVIDVARCFCSEPRSSS